MKTYLYILLILVPFAIQANTVVVSSNSNLSTLLSTNVGGSGAGGILASTDIIQVGGSVAGTATITLTIDANATVTQVKLGCITTGTQHGKLLFNSGFTLTISGASGLVMGATSTAQGIIDMNNGGYLKTTKITNGGGGGSYTLGLSSTIEYTATNTSIFNIYANLVISAGTTTLGSATSVAGDLTISGTGILDVSSSSYQLTLSGTGTSFLNNVGVTGFVEHSGTVLVSGSVTIGGTSITEFDNITISGTLTGSSGHTMVIYGTWTNNGTFNHGGNTVNFTGGLGSIVGTISNNTFFNFQVSGNCTLPTSSTTYIEGDFIYNNYSPYTSVYMSSSNTVCFSGSGDQEIYGTGGSGSISFYRVTVNKPSGTLTLSRNISVSNLLTMTSGTFDTQTYQLSGGGGVTATGGDLKLGELAGATTLPRLSGTYNVTGGTITFDGNGATNQTIRSLNTTASNIQYYNLVISGGSTGLKNLAGAIYVKNDLTISATTLDVTASNYGISVEGSWYNNATFTQRSGTVSFLGSNSESINGTTTTTFYNLGVTKSTGTLTLNQNANVSNVLTLTSGAFALNTYLLSVTNTATTAITRTSGYILSEDVSLTGGHANNQSRLAWTINSVAGTHVFPFGNSSGVYIPFSYAVTSNSIGVLTVSTYASLPDNTPMPIGVTYVNRLSTVLDNSANTVDRYWGIASNILTPRPVGNMVFTYADAETPSNGETSMVAQQYLPGGWAYDDPTTAARTYVPYFTGQAANAATNQVTVTGFPDTLSSSMPWTLVQSATPLPIELLDFAGKSVENKVVLNWNAIINMNSKSFIIEKKSADNTFTAILEKPATGSFLETNHYEAIDNQPNKGMNYYRLKLVDIDGSYAYSNIISASILDKGDFMLFPNPTTGEVNVLLNSAETPYRLTVHNALGQVVLIKNVESGVTNSVLNLEENGIYNLIVEANDQILYKRKVVKL